MISRLRLDCLVLLVLSFVACNKAAPPPPAGPTVTGRLVGGPRLDGYESIGASDPDAKDVVESGGVFLRQKGNKAGAAVGARAMPGLPVDPTDAKICAAASAGTAKGGPSTLTSAEVVNVDATSVCRAEFATPGSKLVTRSFTWLLDPTAKLGVMVVCALEPSDATAMKACLTFVKGVTAAKDD